MKFKQPFFTIISCTYNSAKYLHYCIDSVEKQNYKNFEHIFVDAFSTDGTMDIIDAYKKRNPENVKIFQVKPEGISHAMNYGIQMSSGQVISHLHSDDQLYSPDTLTKVSKVFDETNTDIVSGDCILKSDDKQNFTWPKSRVKKFLIKKFLLFVLFFRNPIAHPSTYIKKEVFEENGVFNGEFKITMDYEFWFRVFKKNKPTIIDDVLSIYLFHEEAASIKYTNLTESEVEKIRNLYKKEYFFEWSVYYMITFIKKVIKDIKA